jgi:hypothetical protein
MKLGAAVVEDLSALKVELRALMLPALMDRIRRFLTEMPDTVADTAP